MKKANEEEFECTCTICMDELKEGEFVRKLSCMHKFHPKCVDKWLLTKPLCPNCKCD